MHQIQYAGLLDSDPHGQDVLTMQTARGAIGTLFAPQFSQAILGAIETMQYDAYNLGREREKTPGTIHGTALGRLVSEVMDDPGPDVLTDADERRARVEANKARVDALDEERYTPAELDRANAQVTSLLTMIDNFEAAGGIVARDEHGHAMSLALPEAVAPSGTKPAPASKRGRPFGPNSKFADETVSARNKRLRAKRIRSYMARNPGISKKLASVHIDRTYAD